MSQARPIYLNMDYIESGEPERLAKVTGRPVILLQGDPRKAVLDVEEDLRDKFAASALSGMMRDFGRLTSSYESIAAHAYKVADALLAERAKREGG